MWLLLDSEWVHRQLSSHSSSLSSSSVVAAAVDVVRIKQAELLRSHQAPESRTSFVKGSQAEGKSELCQATQWTMAGLQRTEARTNKVPSWDQKG